MKAKKYLSIYENLIKSVVELFHPFVEVSVHDLKTGTLAAIYHNFSKRKVGDPSPLNELALDAKSFPDIFPPYYKMNWDGRKLKCSTITIRDENGKPACLICMNVDVSFFEDVKKLSESFLQLSKNSQSPVEIIDGGRIHLIVQECIQSEGSHVHYMNQAQKKKIVALLYQKGAFNYKNAVTLIAKQLKLSRPTIYNYLKEIE